MYTPGNHLIELAIFRKSITDLKNKLWKIHADPHVRRFLETAEKRLAFHDSLSKVGEYLTPYSLVSLFVEVLAELVKTNPNRADSTDLSGGCDETDMYVRARENSTALNNILEQNSDAAQKIWSAPFWNEVQSIWEDFKRLRQSYTGHL